LTSVSNQVRASIEQRKKHVKDALACTEGSQLTNYNAQYLAQLQHHHTYNMTAIGRDVERQIRRRIEYRGPQGAHISVGEWIPLYMRASKPAHNGSTYQPDVARGQEKSDELKECKSTVDLPGSHPSWDVGEPSQ